MKKIAYFLIAILFVSTTALSQELARVRSFDNDGIGFINKAGELVIAYQFDTVEAFSEGLAAAYKDNKWGYIDKKGSWVLEPQFDKAKDFNSGYALVLKDDTWNYIDKSGAILKTPVNDKFYDFDKNRVAFYRVENKIGLINTKGAVILEPGYDVIKPFVNGYARVRNDDKWGMIDDEGNVFIPLEYNETGDYSSMGVFVSKGDSFGIFNNGKMNIIAGADKVWDFEEGQKLTYARKDKNIGFVNSNGDWVIQPVYDKARAFNNGLAPVYNDKYWGYIDETGKEVIPFKYRDAEVFGDNGLAPVKEKKLWGFINKSGEVMIPFEYEIYAGKFSFFSKSNAKGFNKGLARVKRKKEWAFINKSGEPLGGKWYQNLELFSE